VRAAAKPIFCFKLSPQRISRKVTGAILETQKLSDFIGVIYDCIATPATWTRALNNVVDHFESDVVWLSVSNPRLEKTRMAAVAGDAEKSQLLTAHVEQNPFFRIMHKLEIDEPTGLQKLCDLMGPDGLEIFQNSAFVQNYVIPTGMGDGVALSLMNQSDRVATLGMVGSASRSPYTPTEFDTLALLAPHIRRAVTIGDLFETQARESNMFREMVEHFNLAVLVVDADMQLQFANPIAEDYLRDASLLRMSSQKLIFQNELAQFAIQKAVTLCERTEIALAGSGIGVPLHQTQFPAVAHVLPLGRRAERSQFHSRAAAAIFVATPKTDPLPTIDAIAALFGLTSAEKQVARQAANGLAATEIALSRGVSVNTIRTQIDAIYAKTGQNSQTGLQKLILDLTPPIVPGQE
jgi:DNA-binding CsgD family transcriptional regulator/PAS domain-containing protein